ncbi:exodeoxyribonuclease V, gamma chain [Buchnera aphidicola (Cinara tujafilina)]|uniref:Exodeoxyribonuclease V, gamma chain n=1 Tax=Buchnera aphidicola (Cinara tujafilina) TaxID=261317 RepID=F7WZK3_9GAMM|nr:exodeoxyribonuclease V, gamma chain [Buchnera aphidicola (Cinara tujafilina)]
MNITANIDYINYKYFFINLIYRTQKIKKNPLFNKYYLTWNLMSIIHDVPINKNKKMFLYKNFQLCLYLAKLFITYLYLKPHWIYKWENEKNNLTLKKSHIWQKNLWNKLIKKLKNNSFTQLIKTFYLSIRDKKIKNFLPSNIFIICLEKNIPLNNFILSIISEYTIIHKYQYIVTNNIEKNQLKKISKKINLKEKGNSKHLNIRIIKKFFLLKKTKILIYYNNYSLIFFTLKIQKNKKIKYHLYDRSISIHQCISLYQEVEILYQYITQKMNSDTKLKPHNILITAKNIKIYSPYIDYIFKYKKIVIYCLIIKKVLPHTLKKGFFSTIKKLLTINNNYLKYSWILSILDNSYIRKKFSIHSKDISTIYFWILELGIYWGFDKTHLNNLSLPKIEQYTWDFAIKKIISGCFFNKKDNSWNNIFPFSLSHHQGYILLGNFIKFILCLKKLYKNIHTKKKLKSWLNILPNIIKNFFKVSNKNKKFFYQLKKIGIILLYTEYKKIIQKKFLLMKLYMNFFKKKYFLKKYLNIISGTLNFSKLQKIKNIPFKMICILGCTKKIRIEKKNALNLIKTNKFKYDNNQKIFFNTIMSAKNYLYCSYVFNDKNQNIKNSSSLFIDNLLIYIQKKFYYITYSINNKIKKNNNILKYIFHNHLKTVKKNKTNKKILLCNYKKINFFYLKIELKNLIQFWKNPINYFFNKTLKIKINLNENDTLLKNEIFSVGFLEKYKIKKNIIIFTFSKKNKKIFLYYQNTGKIPYGTIGKIFWNNQKKKIKKLVNRIHKNRNQPKKIKFKLKIQEYQISGKLSEINHIGLIRWTVTKINYNNIISLWLEHLVYCALDYKKKSILLSIDDKILEFSSIKKSKALFYLKKYIQGYRMGLKKPILFLKSGINWLNYTYIHKKSNSKNIAIKKFLETWNGNFQYDGEKNNIYVQKIIPKINEKYIKKICNTCKYWYLPVLKNYTIKQSI